MTNDFELPLLPLFVPTRKMIEEDNLILEIIKPRPKGHGNMWLDWEALKKNLQDMDEKLNVRVPVRLLDGSEATGPWALGDTYLSISSKFINSLESFKRMPVTPNQVKELIEKHLKKHINEIDEQLLSFGNIATKSTIKGADLSINATLTNFVDDDLSKLIVQTYMAAGWENVYYNTTRDLGSIDEPSAYRNTTFVFKLC